MFLYGAPGLLVGYVRMPGHHTSKQKRQAEHVADSERRRGKSSKEAKRIGWATTNAQKGFQLMTLDDYFDLVKEMNPAKVSAYHADAAKVRAPDPKRTAHVDRPPPSTSDVSSRLQNERRVSKFPRKMKPTVAMKPISNEEAMAHLRTGTYNPATQKALRWLSALKALATGYGKTSGGGALKAANRGSLPLLGPSGRVAGKPGGSYRRRGISGKKNFGPDGRPGPRGDEAKFGKRSVGKSGSPLVLSGESPRVLAAGGATELSNSLTNVVLKSEGAEMPSQSKNVDFNDLFKSELGDDHLVDCPHCEEPITKSDLAKAHKGKGAVTHQSGPKRGKSSAHVRDQNPEGGTTRGGDGRGVHKPSRGVPGAKKHDEPAGVQNSKGSRTRKSDNDDDSSSDDGSGDVGKSDDVHNFKEGQSVVHKSSAGSDASEVLGRVGGRSTDTHVHFIEPSGKGRMVRHDEIRSAPAGGVQKSVIVRGTEWVRYVDDGSDAALAKSISEGTLGEGGQVSRPLDLNNDLTRLLI